MPNPSKALAEQEHFVQTSADRLEYGGANGTVRTLLQSDNDTSQPVPTLGKPIEDYT